MSYHSTSVFQKYILEIQHISVHIHSERYCRKWLTTCSQCIVGLHCTGAGCVYMIDIITKQNNQQINKNFDYYGTVFINTVDHQNMNCFHNTWAKL